MQRKSKLDKHAATRAIALQTAIDNINYLDLIVINNKITAIANLFGITFNTDGTLLSETRSNEINTLASVLGITFNSDKTLLSETYNAHTHNYLDATISDTADGTGISSDTTRQTQGVL